MTKTTTSTQQQQLIDSMLSKLSAQELETAAQCSYEYQRRTIQQQNKSKILQMEYASQVAQRYLKSKNNNVSVALESLKCTLEFREKMKIKQLRSAFSSSATTTTTTFTSSASTCSDPATMTTSSLSSLSYSPSSSSLSSSSSFSISECCNTTTADILRCRLQNKHQFVQGHDKQGRSTFYFVPRYVDDHDEEWTLKEAIYTMERAIASSESPDKTINTIIDLHGFTTKQAPPMSIGKKFLLALRKHYAGHVHKIFILNAPSSFLFLWSILKVFLGTKTAKKIMFVNGTKKNDSRVAKCISDIYEPNELPSWVVPGGTNNKPLNIDEYLLYTPFDKAFGDNDDNGIEKKM